MAKSFSPPTEVIRQAEGHDELVVQAAELRVTSGPDKGRRCKLERGRVVVGSASDCDLMLEDAAISRRQFEVEATASGFFLRDLGSTNGTFVGGVRLYEALLPEGAVIEVGRDKLRLVASKERERFLLSNKERFGRLFGKSPAMRHCFALLERAAGAETTVLVEGESGTGKELVAASLHERSPRADGPFVVADCGAISPTLIESELFGHERGAFTGATAAHAGALERSHGGTLFLDELGELDLALQPKLLRFLEDHQVRRVGSTESRTVDVRVVAATNRPLEEMVRRGQFREDLFYRLAVLRVRLPPLRARPEDIPLLALELARRLRPELDPGAWLDDKTLRVLSHHDWPGNVRELRNVIERLALLPEVPVGEVLGEVAGAGGGAHPSGVEGLMHLPYHVAKERLLDGFERRYVEVLLREEGGVVARAAKRAEVPRQTFFRLIRKHGLREGDG